MPYYFTNPKQGASRVVGFLATAILLIFCPEVSGQVLTLNRSECVQVEARLDELVPYHKYRELLDLAYQMEEHDIWDPEEYNSKPDTASLKIEDEVTVFFVWQADAVLRIVARKEKNRNFIAQSDPKFSLPATSLLQADQQQAKQQLQKIQKSPDQLITDTISPDRKHWNLAAYQARKPLNMNPYVSGLLVGATPRVHLLVKGKGKPVAFYRILNMTAFSKTLDPEATQPGQVSLVPVFTFEGFHSGFTNEERQQACPSEPEPDDWFSVLKRKFTSLFSKADRSNCKTSEWFHKLDRIYDHIFSVTGDGGIVWYGGIGGAPYEGNRSLPYFTYFSLCGSRHWPWNLPVGLFPEADQPVRPFFAGSQVAGYRVFDGNSHPETRGYRVMPGKFFLPARLKITSVDGIPLANYQPPVLTQVPEIQPPVFPGGAAAFQAFMKQVFRRHNWRGGFTTVALEFDAAGKILKLTPKSALNPAADSFAAAIVGNYPVWLPGRQNGLPIKSSISVAVPVVITDNLDDLYLRLNRVNLEPEFPGGSTALLEFINKNIRYPAQARRAKIEGMVVVQFVVTEEGGITAIGLLKGLTPDLNAEAIRVLKSMPLWNPARENGVPVSRKFNLPVRFQLPVEAAKK